MPCGKRPINKTWDKPRQLRVVKSSRYEKNESSVKVHWKNVVRALEMSYKDEKFWDSNCDTVRDLVGPVIFQRIAKVFNLPLTATKYIPSSVHSSDMIPSSLYYVNKDENVSPSPFENSSDSSERSINTPTLQEEQSTWTMSTMQMSINKIKSFHGKSQISTRSLGDSTKNLYSNTFSKFIFKMNEMDRPLGRPKASKAHEQTLELESQATSKDDLSVYVGSAHRTQLRDYYKRKQNPYYEMLYCNESETDMIKWKSHYKQKTFEVSASDEFSKRAEIMTKQISKDFYDWWVGLGNVEFKSEIKRPEDIEALFQVWFDEHASRGLVLHPKILPCVLQHIAEYVGVPKAACPEVLKRQIKHDIKAETMPAHLMAFGTSLPHHLKHVPPKNNTSKLWRGVKIPEDLSSMSYVWEDIQHLTSTKEFHKWLIEHPTLPTPPFFKKIYEAEQKVPFVVPSDFIVMTKSTTASALDLALPVSQFTIELKEVLSKLMSS